MSQFTVIPTRYAGHTFRSRLEARWAVFFDFIGMSWEYEKEAFSLRVLGKQAGYTPDFWLPQLGAWFEVKGWQGLSDDEARRVVNKMAAFRVAVDARIYVALDGLADGGVIEMFKDEPRVRTVEWGRCEQCLAWSPEISDGSRPVRVCGHESNGIGWEQAKGALLDAAAYRFWDPK
jgi:hypothetical protein